MRDASGKELAARPELTLIKTCRVPSEDVTNAEDVTNFQKLLSLLV